MLFKVYHFDMEKYYCILGKFKTNDGEEATVSFEDYQQVATVDVENLEEVFRATNHIDQDWRNNKEVVRASEHNVRSTSVGDIVVDHKGVKHFCASMGWEEVA